MRAGPSITALATPALFNALAVSTTTVVTRVHAGTFDLYVTGVAPALVRCYALTIIASLATRHASTTVPGTPVSRSVLRKDHMGIRDLTVDKIHEKETVVALANLRCDACAVTAHRTDGRTFASFDVSVTVDACANFWRRACAVAALDAADRLASKRKIQHIVVMNHAIAILADT